MVREQRGLRIAEVANFASISVDRLADFERGEREPSRKQMERLADTYGVSLYSLFGSALPNLPPLPQDFRKADPAPASLTPRGVRSLLLSERISQFSKQLGTEVGYKPVDLIKSVKKFNSTKRRATELRSVFDHWLAPRANKLGFSGTTENRFMSALRLFFEVQGGIININEAPASDYMGFFMEPDAGFPTIFVNRLVSSKKAQLFTLAHEYSHALMGEDGISNPFLARNNIERACNVFAAEFIAPMDAFASTVEKLPKATRDNVTTLIDAVAARTLLSKHASAIRLVEGEYITQKQLGSWGKIFSANPTREKDEEKESAPPTGGGVPHAKRLSEIGHLPIFLANQAINQGLIDGFDVAEGIGLSQVLQDRAFSLANRRFEVALS